MIHISDILCKPPGGWKLYLFPIVLFPCKFKILFLIQYVFLLADPYPGLKNFCRIA